MYNLISNNRVILGPITYSKFRFEDELKALNIQQELPYQTEDAIIINETTGIYPTLPTIMPDHNGVFEQLVGPSFEIIDNKVQYTYTKTDRPVEHIKTDLKATVAANRWKYETSGVTVSIQGNDVWVPTAKGDRDIFLQSMQLGIDNVNWKFDNLWLTITNADLQAIVAAMLAKIQACFDWEAAKVTEIENATDLKTISVVNTDWEPANAV
jgi:hypothetical protein